MKHLPALIVLLLLHGSASVASGADKLPVEVRNAVQNMLEDEWGKGNVQWMLNNVPRAFDRWDSPSFKLEAKDHPRGVVLMQVDVLDGLRLVRRIPLSLRVMPFAWVPVLKADTDRGRVATADNIQWARREVTDVRNAWPESPGDLFSSPYRFRRTMHEGAVLTWADVEAVPDVLRGQPVTIIAQQGRVEVSTTGIAMEDGSRGEQVRVKNPEYNRILEGRVQDRGTVVVQGSATR